MMTRYILPGVLAALVLAGGWIWWQSGTIDALEADKARLERSLVVEREAREQARLAANVAQASADRERARAAEYDALRESLLKGNDDAPLPDWFRAYLDRLLGGVPAPR